MSKNKLNSLNKLKHVVFELSDFFKEREELAELLVLALLSRQHVCILGPPGTGKSAMARALASHFNAKYFEYLITRFTTPEELLGPIDLKKLEEGLFVRVTTSMLPEAEIAFLDEIFKGNSAILNTLLTMINERKYHEAGRVIDVPLNTLIAASNELPEDEKELAALYDRLLIRYAVHYIRDDANFRDMLLSGEVYEPKTRISMDELRMLQEQVAKVDITPILDTVIELRRDLTREGIVASDRRFKQAMAVVRAHALLHGRTVATAEDLKVLQHIMWDDPEQIGNVRKVVMDVVDPFARKIIEYREIIADYERMLDGKIDQADAQEIMSKLKDIENELKQLEKMALSAGKDTTELEEISDKIRELKLTILNKLF